MFDEKELLGEQKWYSTKMFFWKNWANPKKTQVKTHKSGK